LLSIPPQKVSPVDGKKNLPPTLFTTLNSDRDAKYDVDCAEKQHGDNGDEYGADGHVKYFLLSFLVVPVHENKSENYGLKRKFLLGH
jgi:hypothetical protein